MACLLPLAAAASDDGGQDDWRKTGTDRQKLDNLVEVIPGTGQVMIEMGERYKNLYWAARLGEWEFAEYQAKEMEELLEKLEILNPKRKSRAAGFIEAVFPALNQALGTRDFERFGQAFEDMRGQCNECHVGTGHAFVRLKPPVHASSPVLSMQPAGE